MDLDYYATKNTFIPKYNMSHMSLLSKSELQFLQGKKIVSKSYEYKLKSIIKRKISTLLEKELPLLSHFFPNLDLTKFGKEKSPLKATIPGSNPGRSIYDVVFTSKEHTKDIL